MGMVLGRVSHAGVCAGQLLVVGGGLSSTPGGGDLLVLIALGMWSEGGRCIERGVETFPHNQPTKYMGGLKLRDTQTFSHSGHNEQSTR